MLAVTRVLLAVGVATLFTSGLVLLARANYKRHRMHGTDDVETAYITAVSTLYGIFVAFMIFSVWTKYTDAQNAIAAEANQIGEIYQLVGALDDPLRSQIRGLAIDYAQSVVTDEWKTMVNGKPSARTRRIVTAMWAKLNQMNPEVVRDPVIRDHLLSAWSKTTDFRRLRLDWCAAGLAPIAYSLLIVGGLITLGLACVFTVDDLAAHLIKASALASIVTLMLIAIWSLDHPFRHNQAHIQPAPFVELLQTLPNDAGH